MRDLHVAAETQYLAQTAYEEIVPSSALTIAVFLIKGEVVQVYRSLTS